ncbi:Allergen Fus c 3 [Colletotrichum sidae]|uniref:Allergen Fus c 3 n=1 Tax=Colletotrichum sidae TaxID=1347389 RepID=A0A4R8TLV8_9PEZI|nr:Allergen Fus c 3 [Colletotrichum sidae]
MMASMPLSPHFSPTIFGGSFATDDGSEHATRHGNQATSSPDHLGPHSINDLVASTATTIGQTIAGIHWSPTLHHVQQEQQQQYHQRPHPSALRPGDLTAAESQDVRQQFVSAPIPADQGPPDLLHFQGTQHAPAAWFPPGFGPPASLHHQQQHAAVTSSSFGANPAGTVSAAQSDPSNEIEVGEIAEGIGSGQSIDFGFAATRPGEQSFLGGAYANITPLSTVGAAGTTAIAAAVTVHPHPVPPPTPPSTTRTRTTTDFDFHFSPWRPQLQDKRSVTLTPTIAAAAAAELNYETRNHQGKGTKNRMEDASDVKEAVWDEEAYTEHTDRRNGVTRPRKHQPQRKSKRRALAEEADADADAGDGDGDESHSPARRTSISGRSAKSVSVASTVSSSKTAPAPRLRSASRTSKNASQKPSDTAEERRNRASHNLVEKQYRNRLNAQFEGLLNALPEQVRGPAGVAAGAGAGTGDGDGGGGGGDDSDPQHADQERRVSKAEVLDMARRHIKSLERERHELQRERSDLLRNLEMMEHEMAGTGEIVVGGGGGDAGTGQLDEFLDVEGPPDQRGGDAWRGS